MNVDLDSIVEAFAPLWIPTLTFDALDPRTHEAVDTFSVMGALLECDVWPDGWRALEAVVAPATSAFWRWSVVPEKATIEDIRECQRLSRLAVEELDLQSWLQEKDRTKEQVLQAFITAIARSKKTGERQ